DAPAAAAAAAARLRVTELMQLDAPAEEDRSAQRVPAPVEELDGDARVASDPAQGRLLRKPDGLALGEDDDIRRHVLGVRVGPLHVVPEDQPRVDARERDLSRERDEGARAVVARARRDVDA